MYKIADSYMKHVEAKSGRKFTVEELRLCLHGFYIGWIKRGSVDDTKFREIYKNLKGDDDNYYTEMMDVWTNFL